MSYGGRQPYEPQPGSGFPGGGNVTPAQFRYMPGGPNPTNESLSDRMWRQCQEHPGVPLGTRAG